MQKPSEHMQTVAVSYHVERMHRGQLGNKVPEPHNAPCAQDETRPQGVILGWSPQVLEKTGDQCRVAATLATSVKWGELLLGA
jgi:hypothetical protein